MGSLLLMTKARIGGGGGIPTRTSSRDNVYVAAVPLVAAKGPAQLLMSSAYSLNFWDLQHFLVLITPPHPHQVLVFDYQPKDPESLDALLSVITGKPVPEEDAILMATEFNESWNTDLRVGQHDCRDYTNGLIEHLTGKKLILDQLRQGKSMISGPRILFEQVIPWTSTPQLQC
ncbi:hypothetical protein ACFE04_018364 [Oxalis oulophora]